MFQNIEGTNVFVVDLTDHPRAYLPVHDGGNRLLRPYADALDAAIRTGVVTKPGKYAVEVNLLAQRWNVYKIEE